jgi:simple sugar transport system ATP-binding protein
MADGSNTEGSLRMADTGRKPALEARGISKFFGAVQALDGVDFAVAPGEVVAVMGDNGAGKSTLVKILVGALLPDAGQVWLDGEPVTIDSPSRARELGIETVYQDLALADDLPAPHNLFLGRVPVKSGVLGRLGWIDVAKMREQTTAHLAELGVTLKDDRADVKHFSGGQKQSVAIARAAMWGKRLVVMDEPTAALGVVQTQAVLGLIKRLKERGIPVVMISHSIPEVMAVADRIVVLRLGRNAATLDPAAVSEHDVVSAITGAHALEVSA